jgi:hypothetical protein
MVKRVAQVLQQEMGTAPFDETAALALAHVAIAAGLVWLIGRARPQALRLPQELRQLGKIHCNLAHLIALKNCIR